MQEFCIIIEKANCSVAGRAEKAARLAGDVIVIDDKAPHGSRLVVNVSFRKMTDCADATLDSQHGIVFRDCKAVGLELGGAPGLLPGSRSVPAALFEYAAILATRNVVDLPIGLSVRPEVFNGQNFPAFKASFDVHAGHYAMRAA